MRISEEDLGTFVQKYDAPFRDVGTVFLEYVARILTQDSTLVDVGCGRTSYGADVYKKAKRRIGLDVDAYARENPVMDEVHIMTDELFPLSDACADVVTAQWVVEHVEHPDMFLGEVFRVLKPGGSFVFMTTNIRAPLIRITSWIPMSIASFIRTRLLHFAHDETFPRIYAMNSEKTLRALAQKHGFTVECIDHVESYGYFRFSSMLLRLYIGCINMLRFVMHHREMHIVGVFKKR